MKNISIATVALAALLLTGCSTGGAPSPEPATTLSPASAPASTASDIPDDAPVTSSDGVSVFGETWTYEDGTKISVSKPVAGKATESATAPGVPLSIYTVSVTNGTKKPLTPAAFAQVTYGPQGVPAEQVFDSAQGLADSLDNVILPGKKATVRMAFAMPVAEPEVTFTISPSFDYDQAIYSAK